MAPNEKSAKDRLRKKVEYTVEHGLRVWRNDICALAQTPCNGVKDPKNRSQASAKHESSLDITSIGLCMYTRLPHELVHDINKSDAA
jgi:hypothetical protein